MSNVITTPEQPPNSYRVTIELLSAKPRLDQVLITQLRNTKHAQLRRVSRTVFKELFKSKKIRIKGQPALPSSALAKGTTYVDILGFEND